MKNLFPFIAILFIFLSCETKSKDDQISIVLLYEEPINGYFVSGLFYPFDNTAETGQVILTFIPTNGGDTLVFSNIGCFEKENPEYQMKFTGKNIMDCYFSEDFDGYHNGDTLICHYYHDNPGSYQDSPLFYDAEFQFFDVDFDDDDEFLINDYSKRQGGNCYTVYEIGPNGFVLKDDYPFDYITNETKFFPESKQIYIYMGDELYDTVDLSHQAATPNGI